MATDLTVRNNQLATVGGFQIEGMEGLDQHDVILPRYTIVQPTSQGKGDNMGWLHNNLTNTPVKELQAVILKVSRTRTLWSGNMADKKPECSSYDGITGTVHGACASCDYAKWQEDREVKSCKAGYLYLCCDPNDGDSMFLFGAMGTSVKPAKVLNSLFVNKRRSPFSAVVTLATDKVEDPSKGKYFILKAQVARWLDEKQTSSYREMFQAMQGVTIHEVEADAAGEGVDSGDLPF